MNLGIVRCRQTEVYCPGTGCFNTVRNKSGSLEGIQDVELVGFISCGGCPGKQVLHRVEEMVKRGADTIAFASCISKGTPIEFPCPFSKKMKTVIEDKFKTKVKILDYTHD